MVPPTTKGTGDNPNKTLTFILNVKVAYITQRRIIKDGTMKELALISKTNCQSTYLLKRSKIKCIFQQLGSCFFSGYFTIFLGASGFF